MAPLTCRNYGSRARRETSGPHHLQKLHHLSSDCCHQQMGQLPSNRVSPSSPFVVTGIDYAGPFTMKKGHTRKPTLIKVYLAIFVCFSTKAAHLEVVSNMTTETFLACLHRLRGLPTKTHTDNGSNFKGAKNDLSELFHFLQATSTHEAVNSYLLSQRVQWHCIPERAPTLAVQLSNLPSTI